MLAVCKSTFVYLKHKAVITFCFWSGRKRRAIFLPCISAHWAAACCKQYRNNIITFENIPIKENCTSCILCTLLILTLTIIIGLFYETMPPDKFYFHWNGNIQKTRQNLTGAINAYHWPFSDHIKSSHDLLTLKPISWFASRQVQQSCKLGKIPPSNLQEMTFTKFQDVSTHEAWK